MSDNPIHSSRADALHSAEVHAQRAAQTEQVEHIAITQVVSDECIAETLEGGTFNPFAMAKRFDTLETKSRRDVEKSEKEEESEESGESSKTGKEEGQKKIQRVQRISQIADNFSRRSNQELAARTLLLLKERITKGDSAEDVIRKVLEVYSDHSLADEALDFLIQTADDPDVATTVKLAKDTFNASFAREIISGKNITEQAREFSTQGLGSPTALRDMYREITGNPRDPNTLFDQLSTNFGYEKMKKVIEFMLHSLGADLKSQGPSMPRGQLHRLMTETRVLQAILGVYRFFRSRMKLIQTSFMRSSLVLPTRITFEVLAKQYMRYLAERYPSPDKVLQMALQLGIAEELLAQVILFTQLRDACRQIAPRLFKSEQHRQDTLRSFMEALEQIEEDVEEEEEKSEESKKKKTKPKKLT